MLRTFNILVETADQKVRRGARAVAVVWCSAVRCGVLQCGVAEACERIAVL